MIGYNPHDPRLQADPYLTYQWLRDEAPLYRNDELDFWALTRHQDVAGAWRDVEGFSNDHGPTLEQWGPEAPSLMSFIAMDPPQHTRMRALISRGFTPARVAQLEPRIRQLTRTYLDRVLDRGSFDFVNDFVAMIPMDVISELIGVPAADRPMVLGLSHRVMTRDDVDGGLPQATQDANMTLALYYVDLVRQRRREPREDLATALVQSEIDGQRLSDADVVAALMLLGVAGNETTIKLLGTAWRSAWQHPDQRAAAFAGNITAWVEETLRHEGPSQFTARRVSRDVDLYGQSVPAGARLLLVIAAANRDERVFPGAGRYDLSRDTSATLAFGLGPHFCLGAALARLEARVVLEELVAAVEPDYEVDLNTACWTRSPSVRGHSSLPTTIKARSRRS